MAIDFIALLLGAIICQTLALEEANIVRELVITTPNSTTVPLGQHLYTITKSRYHVQINSSDVNYKPCTIATDPFEDMIQGKIDVQTSDREIFIWGIQNQETNQGTTQTYYTLLSVDPWQCRYTPISIPESDAAETPKNFLPRLIIYTDWLNWFDIFFPSLKNCAPCRFTRRGDRANIYFVRPVLSTSELPFYILWLNPNYLYVHDLDDGRSILKYLGDEKMETIHEKNIDHSVETVTARKGTILNIGICYKKRNDGVANSITRNDNGRVVNSTRYNEVRCERLNSKLQSVVSIVVPISEKDVSTVSLSFDDLGNSYISFAEDNELHVYIYDIDGQLLQSYNLGDVDERFQQFKVDSKALNSSTRHSYWDVHGFLIDKQYCVVTKQMKTDGYEKALHVVKCISVENYINQPKF